jgi:Protein of unknown function (DUF2452)
MTENSAKGRHSFDANIGGDLVPFLNRNVSTYGTEAGGAKFDLIPVEKQKDIMVNVARMHAEQEYNRIMELVAVLQKQAADIKRRLEITDMVHEAKYDFQIYHGQTYWLLYDQAKACSRLSHSGPNDWSTGCPEHYQYICKIKWLGDHSWTEVE